MNIGNDIFSVIIAGINLLGLVFSIAGIASIEWDFTNETNKVLFVIMLPLFIFTFGISVLFFFIFRKRMLKSSSKTLCLIAAISAAIFAFLGLLFGIISLAIGCSKFSDAEDILKPQGINRPSKGEKATMMSMICLSFLMDLLQIPLWAFIILHVLKYRGNLNTSTSTSEVKVTAQREINLN